MMAALLSLQDQSATGGTAQTPSSLFSKFDTDGDGQVSKSEFDTALTGAGASTSNADALFAKLDANGDGSISQSELAKAKNGHHHHMHGGDESQASGASGQSAIDSLLSSTDASRRNHADRRQCGWLEHDDDYLCRRQHGRDDDAGGVYE